MQQLQSCPSGWAWKQPQFWLASTSAATWTNPAQGGSITGIIEGLNRIYGLFVRLGEAVEYKAIDGRPVDLVFLLLSPLDAGADHLKALASISRVTRSAATLEKMRGARSRDALAAVLM